MLRYFAVLAITLLSAAQSEPVPENAHMLGNAWYCNEGYQRQGNSCVRLQVPPDAHLLGNSWYCNEGFYRQGEACKKLEVPENAHVLGNSWYCNEGYSRNGDKCVKLVVPRNAHVLGNNWYCDDGYKRQGNRCTQMTEAEKAQLEQFMREQKSQETDGALAYVTKIESDRNDILRLENGAIVEIKAGYLGYVGNRKTAVLFGSGQKYQILIERKRILRCDLLKGPDVRGKPAKQVHVSEVRGQGAILLMLDGTIYEVDPVDQIISSLWLGVFDALLIEGNLIVNFDTGESVSVHRIK